MLALRLARPDEGPALTELCLRSKAVWGYDAAFMQACAPELALTSEVIASSIVHVAEIAGCVAGVAEIKTNGPVARLEKLFVEPGMFRAGIGRNLLDWAKVTARAAG